MKIEKARSRRATHIGGDGGWVQGATGDFLMVPGGVLGQGWLGGT